MTERTIRTMAKELAGKFYEGRRSDKFRSHELVNAKALQQGADGVAREVTVKVPFLTAYPTAHFYIKAHWPHFYNSARQCLVGMLAQPDSRVSRRLKDSIVEAIKEDRIKQLATGGAELLQVKMDNING